MRICKMDTVGLWELKEIMSVKCWLDSHGPCRYLHLGLASVTGLRAL